VTAPKHQRTLTHLRRLAKSKLGSHPGMLILPHLALRIHGRSPVEYAQRYFRAKVRAAFASPLAADFDFCSEQPTQVRIPSRAHAEVVAAIQDELYHYHLYLSNFLTHPRYGPERQVGFCRGDTLEPVDLRETAPGMFTFRVRGIVVGRRDLLRQIAGPNRDGPAAPASPKPGRGVTRIFILIPTRPDAREVGNTEWYDFTPKRWRRKHPHIPLRPPTPILIWRRPEAPVAGPWYDRFFRTGVVRIALLYGYDSEGHNTTNDARDTWQILTAHPSRRFRPADTGPYGYHGPGFGFSDPTGGHFTNLRLDGMSVFRRGVGEGSGPVRVRYSLGAPLRVGGHEAKAGTVFVEGHAVAAGRTLPSGTIVERDVSVEVRLYNFDKNYHLSSQRLIEQFLSVFQANELILYDGHANYGGGFYIGPQPNDILWAADIGSYRRDFSERYQIFAIGACHAAGYFADLFYNELRPRKSPRNLDIMAAVNETAFDDAVHQSMAVMRFLLQLDTPAADRPATYAQILLRESRPASFQPYIGVFAPRAGGGRL